MEYKSTTIVLFMGTIMLLAIDIAVTVQVYKNQHKEVTTDAQLWTVYKQGEQAKCNYDRI